MYVNEVSCAIKDRLLNVRQTIYNNMCIAQQQAQGAKTEFKKSISLEDIILIQLLTGGALKINNRNIDSQAVFTKVSNIIDNLDKMENVIFGSTGIDSVNSCNLILGDLVDVELCLPTGDKHITTLLRNIDFLVIPDTEKYRENIGQLEKGSVLQKLLTLDEVDIVNTVFKLRSYKSRLGESRPITISTTDDLIDITNEEDFILLLDDNLAFITATINKDDNEEPEQEFFVINSKPYNISGTVEHLNDYSILSWYINTPELQA